MTIENLKDIVTRQLESKYILEEKVFEAKNFTVYIATQIENNLAYNQLVLIKHLCNENRPYIFGTKRLVWKQQN